jgi:hypothetical protein
MASFLLVHNHSMNRCARVVKVVKIEQICDCRFAALFPTAIDADAPLAESAEPCSAPASHFSKVVMLALLKPIVSSPWMQPSSHLGLAPIQG